MKFASLLTVALLTIISYSCLAQEYSYTHYDITEGLAGSTVYSITQDPDGFLWLGTESGVSRFDGTQFKNFTTADGLPDIEILKIFSDSRGRVWMAPFQKSVCYYYKGRIHNQENDTLLGHIRLNGNIENFAEDTEGNVLIQEKTALYLLSPRDSLRYYNSIAGRPINKSVALSRSVSGHFLVQAENKVFELDGRGFSFVCSITMADYYSTYIAMRSHSMIWRESGDRAVIRSFATRQDSYIPFKEINNDHVSFSFIDDSLIYFNGSRGTREYNLYSGRSRIFLPGIEVSRTFRDMSDNLWFTTLGKGIFRLNSEEFKTLRLISANEKESSIFAITRIANQLWIGNNLNYIFKISLPDYKIELVHTYNRGRNRILYLEETREKKVFICSDAGMGVIDRDMNVLKVMDKTPVKSVFRENNGNLLVAAPFGAVIIDGVKFRVTDTIWRERSSAIYATNDTIYLGTLNGLYRILPNKNSTFLGEKIPFLRKRISAIIASPDHILWVAAYDGGGVVGLKNDSVVTTLTTKGGLTSDICRTLTIHDHILWVGTDKGLNKVELDKPGYPVTRYTANDGLGSDIINSVFADSSTIYVGTPAGLSYFDESKATVGESCRVYLLAAVNKGQNRIGDSAKLILPYKDNGIRFEFAGISYRSAGNLIYRYRLRGLDSSWKETREVYLDYPTLPSGHYNFELQAVNKFGISSRLLSVPFTVETPFWKTIWFFSLIILTFFALTWLFVSLRIRGIRRRQAEKEQLNQRMIDLEHKALQAQMNPHFIFNCLNSIQQFVFTQDILVANKYISGLAKLIRATLHHSSLSFINLAAEIDFLDTYLSLEKLRFKDKMSYSIETGPGIDTRSLLIPPMLIQPYVENSMRHGLRHKKSGNGYIRILMVYVEGRLKITIDDNGIGREGAARYKTAEHIEYQSKGMSLTADRIRMMNTTYGKDINIEITDLVDKDGGATGTRVVIMFRPFDTDRENQNL